VLTTKMSSWYGGVSSDARTAARGSDGGPPSARRAYGTATRTGLTTRHVGSGVDYHFQKGCIGFFSIDFARKVCQL
jgi:hypothetical protein